MISHPLSPYSSLFAFSFFSVIVFSFGSFYLFILFGKKVLIVVFEEPCDL